MHFHSGKCISKCPKAMVWSGHGHCSSVSSVSGLNFNGFRLNFKKHWGRVTHICASKLNIIVSDNAWPAPSHHLNKWWNIVNWTPRNKLRWNLNRNSHIVIHENAFENIIWKRSEIFPHSCVATLRGSRCLMITKLRNDCVMNRWWSWTSDYSGTHVIVRWFLCLASWSLLQKRNLYRITTIVTCRVPDALPCTHIKYTELGGRLNKKDGLTRCGDSHVKDKTS